MTLELHVRTDLIKLRKRLAKLGISDVTAMDYESYLRSTLWKKIRGWVFDRDKLSCVICKCKNPQFPSVDFDVHHRNYDLATLEGRDDSQLITLCRSCHWGIEYFPNGDKRTSLLDKEAEYQRLLALHRSIVKNGMHVRIHESKKNGSISYAVSYHGPPSYYEFYTLDGLMNRFTLSFFITNRDKLRVPLPFSSAKFRQPSGANIIEVSTNKSVVRVTCSDAGAMVKVSKNCTYPVKRHLLKVICETKPWRIESLTSNLE